MSVQIIVPKFGEGESIPTWVERSLREGNFLHRMLQREKADTNRRMQQKALPYKNYERRKGSEFELLSVMDARTFQRWATSEPGIIEDPNEFKKLVKDNPVMTPWRR
jgi:hypothetical protein